MQKSRLRPKSLTRLAVQFCLHRKTQLRWMQTQGRHQLSASTRREPTRHAGHANGNERLGKRQQDQTAFSATKRTRVPGISKQL